MYQYLLALILAVSAAQQLASCYNPDGSVVPLSRGYQPCISTQNVDSMCCLLNITILESGNDEIQLETSECLTNGMCVKVPAAPGDVGYYRGSCTDKTWKSPNCLKACTDVSNGGNRADIVDMWTCPDGSWCCGFKNSTCCDEKLSFSLPATIAPYANSSSALSSAPSTAISTATSTAFSTPTSTSSPSVGKSSSNSGGLIGLGATLGVLVLVIGMTLVGFLIRKNMRVRQRGTASSELGGNGRDRSTNPMLENPLISVRSRSELEVPTIAVSELDGVGANTK